MLGRRPGENVLVYVLRRLRGAIPWRVCRLGQRLRSALPWRLRRLWRRITPTPRLGTLHQHPPRPLGLPRRYGATAPPDPAPRISIVTPTLDQRRYLESTLDSVLGQAYPALEHIVMDGGSADGTVELLRLHQDRLAHWESGPDGGQAAALNRGFAHATGDVLAYLNSDDLLLPGALAYVARYFDAHPKVDAIYGHRIVVDGDGRRVGSWILPPHSDTMLALADYVPQETLFWRRSLWEMVGGALDESLHYALDWDLLLRMRAAGATFARVPRFLAAFRVHDEQKTQRLHDVGRAECRLLLDRTHGRVPSDDEVWARLRPYMRHHVALDTAYRLAPLRALGLSP